MKCERCGTDSKLKDRTASFGRCRSCGHQFVFEPTKKEDQKITDPFFAKAIADVSANNTLFFTPKQFLYLLNQKVKRKSFPVAATIFIYVFFSFWATGFLGGFLSLVIGKFSYTIIPICLNLWVIFYLFNNTKDQKLGHLSRKKSAALLQYFGIFLLVVGIVGSLAAQSKAVYFCALLLSPFVWILGRRQKEQLRNVTEFLVINQVQANSWLERWTSINGPVAKILPLPSPKLQPVELNPDVTAYSFDRLLVCQTQAITQMLIANHFHFENNCAILSIDGYPENIFETTMQMLRRNPELKVYALHDCSALGMKVAYDLKQESRWFRDSDIPIIDLGLLPRQVLRSEGGFFVQVTSAAAQDVQNLPLNFRTEMLTAERKWLEAGKFVELESLTPQKLIKILQRSIAENQALGTESGSDLVIIGDSGSYFYGSDSFG